jgi:hypothetical protein
VTFLNGTANLGTGVLSGGSAALTTSSLTVGSYPIEAKYPGDSTFFSSTSAVLTQIIGKYATTTTLGSSGSPSIYGKNVTFTAGVTSASAVPLTGDITFKNGNSTLGTISLVGGVAILSDSTLTAETHSITALYRGDANNESSTSLAVSQVVTTAATHTALISSLNPSMTGQAVTFTATMTSTTSGTPTGAVVFKSGTKSLGSKTLTDGTAVLTTSSLAPGMDTVTATYGGSEDFSASASTLVQVVN